MTFQFRETFLLSAVSSKEQKTAQKFSDQIIFWHLGSCQGQKKYHEEIAWQRFGRTFGWTFSCDLPQNPCFHGCCPRVVQKILWCSSCNFLALWDLLAPPQSWTSALSGHGPKVGRAWPTFLMLGVRPNDPRDVLPEWPRDVHRISGPQLPVWDECLLLTLAHQVYFLALWGVVLKVALLGSVSGGLRGQEAFKFPSLSSLPIAALDGQANRESQRRLAITLRRRRGRCTRWGAACRWHWRAGHRWRAAWCWRAADGCGAGCCWHCHTGRRWP